MLNMRVGIFLFCFTAWLESHTLECWAYYLFNTLPTAVFVILFKK